MTKYDHIGTTHSQTRAADSRIVDTLVRLLGLQPGKTIADIGAGTGNYSCALAEKGFIVKAVEPSSIMRRQAAACRNVEWFDGVAEHIPLENDSVSGVVSILAVHHFANLTRAFLEMARVCRRGPIVFFTFDPRECQRTWLAEYFPSIWADAFRVFSPIHDVAALLSFNSGREVSIVPFRVPHDISDNFAVAGWRYPDRYLSESYRANMSPFRLADREAIRQGVARLEKDLRTGRWESEYGNILQLEKIDAGYCFLKAGPRI